MKKRINKKARLNHQFTRLGLMTLRISLFDRVALFPFQYPNIQNYQLSHPEADESSDDPLPSILTITYNHKSNNKWILIQVIKDIIKQIEQGMQSDTEINKQYLDFYEKWWACSMQSKWEFVFEIQHHEATFLPEQSRCLGGK